MFASKARSGPIPLRLEYWGVENKNGGPALEGRTAVIVTVTVTVQEFLSQP